MEPQRTAYSYIRFSTPEQKKGTSFQRQFEATVKYCKEKGYRLDKRLSFYDFGRSAYHGTHRTKGELGQLMKLVNEGKIPSGSVLIIENLDRLSREHVMDAFDQFRAIINAGITIVTLQDCIEYSKESIGENWTQLIISITYMAKAYKESKDKSDRGKDTWKIKRKNISTESKLTSRAPLWLNPKKVKISENRSKVVGFTRNEKACNTIERIFMMKKEGMYNEKIASILNQEDPESIWMPPYNKKRKSSGWRASYIAKILKNRAVIGEYTPCVKVEGKRVPIPEMTDSNYFPKAFDNVDLFYEVQYQLEEKGKIRGRLGGKTGQAKNLFKNVVRCGLCGKPMHYIDKGKPPKGGIYLHCDSSRRKVKEINCTAKMVRYDEFEKIFFDRFDEEAETIKSTILPDDNQRTLRIKQIDSKIIANTKRITEHNNKINAWAERVASPNVSEKNKQVYEQLMTSERSKAEKLINENEKLQKEQNFRKLRKDENESNLSLLPNIYEMLGSIKDEEKLTETRHKLNIEITRMFEWIKIYPLQEPYQQYKEIEPGIVQIMRSKFIDKITYKLRDLPLPKAFKSHGIIPIKSHIDIGNQTLESLLKGLK